MESSKLLTVLSVALCLLFVNESKQSSKTQNRINKNVDNISTTSNADTNSALKLSIGFIYCDASELAKANEAVRKLNSEPRTYNAKKRYQLKLKPLRLDADTSTALQSPIALSQTLCKRLIIDDSVYAVVVAAGTQCLRYAPDDTALLVTISFTFAYYQIPVLDLKDRRAIFSDKTIHSSHIRMTPPYFHQSTIWIELLKEFEWKTANLVHGSDSEARILASRFHYMADLNDIKIVENVEYESGSGNLSQQAIKRLTRSTSRVFLLQAAEAEDAFRILSEMERADLMKSGNVWIVAEEIMKSAPSLASNIGFLTVKYKEESNDSIHSSLALIKRTFEYYDLDALKGPARNCNESGLDWPTGKRAYDDIVMNKHIIGERRIEFDENGDRTAADYLILNMAESGLIETVGEYKTTAKGSHIEIDKLRIVWPGASRLRPDGSKWLAKFRIVVIEEKPFIFKTLRPPGKQCAQIREDSIDCPFSSNNATEAYCCYGYCIDLIRLLSKQLRFEYELYLVPDGLYGDYDVTTNTWNGLMGELASERADMILAPLTINPERVGAADFTKPFKYQGITILVKRKGIESSLLSFAQPFEGGLWLMVFVSIHIVAFCLYLLDRFSPFSQFKTSNNTEEDALNLSRALWFTWGVLLNSGIGESTPRSLSGRVLGMFWACFTMIMISSYTANLAAFLVLDRPEADISGINDARLRNPSENYSYATVRGSAVERYFKRQIELSLMHRTMENNNYETADAAIEGLKSGKISALIWDSSRLEYEARQSCEFITTGELFGRSSYGLALKKANPWVGKLSYAILGFHESGRMEDLDAKWISINSSNCQSQYSTPSTLGLKNMADLFVVVAGGVLLGICLLFFEIKYKKRKDKKIREHELSRKSFAIWRKNVEKRKMLHIRNSIDVTNAANAHEMRMLAEMRLNKLSCVGGSKQNRNNGSVVDSLSSMRTGHEPPIQMTAISSDNNRVLDVTDAPRDSVTEVPTIKLN